MPAGRGPGRGGFGGGGRGGRGPAGGPVNSAAARAAAGGGGTTGAGSSSAGAGDGGGEEEDWNPVPPTTDPLAAAYILSLQAQLKTITDSLDALKVTAAAIPGVTARAVMVAQIEAAAAQQRDAQDKAEAARVRGANVAELVQLNPPLELRKNNDADFVVCGPCDEHGSRNSVRNTGWFAVVQRGGFTEMRKSIVAHLASEGHFRCIRIAAKRREEMHRLHNASMSIGMAGYFDVKEALSYYSFERTLVLLSEAGVSIGTLNHSRMFCSGFVSSIHHVLVVRLRTWLGEPVPQLGGRLRSIAVAGDKSTELRRTSQHLAMLILVDGEIKDILMASHVVLPGGGDAEGLAKAIIKEVNNYIPDELPQRIASYAFDGQYIVADVPGELRKLMGSDVSNAWVTGQWDGAHLLELAANDVREDKEGTISLISVPWYAELAEKIALLLNKFQFGKGHEELRQLAADLHMRLHNPAKFCATRFNQAERKVIENVLHNFTLYHEWYTDASTASNGRTLLTKEEEANAGLLDDLTDMLFVGHLICLNEIFHHTSMFSLKCQTVNMLPWELQEEEGKLLATLEEIWRAAESKGGKEPKVGRLLEKFFPGLFGEDKVWDKFANLGTFKGKELTYPVLGDPNDSDSRQVVDDSNEAAKLVIKDIFCFTKALWHFAKTRFVDCKGAPRQGDNGGFQYKDVGGKAARQLVERSGACFDLRRLCREPCLLDEREEALEFIYEAAAASGAGPPLLDILMEQHEELRKRLVSAAQTDEYKKLWFDEFGSVRSGTVIMKSLFTNEQLWKGLGDILWMFEQCALKVRNEAVVEGMGSIVNLHADPRRHLSAEAYNKEAFIHYNGPPLPKARDIIKEALTHYFAETRGGVEHFIQTSWAGQRGAFSLVSEVIQRHKREEARLPCWGK